MSMSKLLGPWLHIESVKYHIRCPIDKLNASSINTLLINTEATIVCENDSNNAWHYLIFVWYPMSGPIYSNVKLSSLEEAKIACDNHLIELDYTLLTEEQVKKIGVLL